MLAGQQGVRAEGIGSRTRSYFWVNAFVREFAAAVYSEGKQHLRVIAELTVMLLGVVTIVCLAVMRSAVRSRLSPPKQKVIP